MARRRPDDRWPGKVATYTRFSPTKLALLIRARHGYGSNWPHHTPLEGATNAERRRVCSFHRPQDPKPVPTSLGSWVSATIAKPCGGWSLPRPRKRPREDKRQLLMAEVLLEVQVIAHRGRWSPETELQSSNASHQLSWLHQRDSQGGTRAARLVRNTKMLWTLDELVMKSTTSCRA